MKSKTFSVTHSVGSSKRTGRSGITASPTPEGPNLIMFLDGTHFLAPEALAAIAFFSVLRKYPSAKCT
ncbi:hypothetical protein HK096_002179, partial [Nowakowskiella sp. JEL0078]